MANLDYQDEIIFEEELEQYLWADSPNKGFVQIPKCFRNCLFISNGAKEVMASIYARCYSGKTKAFPGHATLCLELQISKKTLINRLIELRDKKILDWVRRANSSNIYKIKPLYKSPYIIVSDLTWEAINAQQVRSKNLITPVKKFVKDYQTTAIKFFILYGIAPTREAIRKTVEAYVEGGKEVPNYFIKPTCEGKEVNFKSSKHPSRKKKKEKTTLAKWLNFFKQEYKKHCGLVEYKATTEDFKHLKTLTGVMDDTTLKKAIILYLTAEKYKDFRALRYMQQQRTIDILVNTIKGNYNSVDDYLASKSPSSPSPAQVSDDSYKNEGNVEDVIKKMKRGNK